MELSTYALESLRADGDFLLYRGRSDADPRRILVVVPSSKHPGQAALERLEHEYSLRTRLDAAWAVVPLALVREKGKTALVLEDPGGQPLDLLLRPPLEFAEFLRISVGLGNALGRLHERGIIHRDIKPANVTVDITSGRVWLTGFGIASDLPRERQAPDPPETIAGTLAYMAPEQTGRLNRSIDSRSDLYSLGVTLYETLTGALPFGASDPTDLIHCHIARQPASPQKRRKEVPPALSAIILKLLAKAPEERYQTAAGLEADLKKCLEELELPGGVEPFLLGAHDVSDRLLIPEKLYGRDRETKALLEAFDRVAASGTPELVLVSGYSGIGKSSVVNELHKAIVLPRGIFVSGKFDQFKRDIPYATLAQAFRTLVSQILSGSDTQVERWRDTIRNAMGLNGQLVVNLIPELELIIGKQPPVPELPAQEAQNRFDEVLRRFLCAFSRKEHPLALFLDDLQWLDAASLKFLEQLVTHPDVAHLMLIGAYRDNEVSRSHPLMLALDSIRKTKAIVRDIVLAPLTLEGVNQLIADSLRQNRKRTGPLARLVNEKTGANPFFVIQFLTALAEEGLLEFDRRKAAWRWDINCIRARRITENIVDLMVGKLNRLPDTAREGLKELAAFGNTAKAADLTILYAGPDKAMQSDLWEAVNGGFVVRLADSYTFVHDRVQEAAYSLIPEDERAATHLRIAELLLSNAASDELEDKIFEIVNQFNRGADLLAAPEERERVAELNLIAGRRAQAASAHGSALAYLSAGCALLAPESWERQYELTFALELRRAESEFVTGHLETAEERLSMLSHRARSIVDDAAVTCLRLDLYTTLDRSDRAVEACLQYLWRLGVSWSPHPTEKEVLQEYEKMWRLIGSRPIEALVDLPPMTDPDKRATMDVLTMVMPPAMFTDKNLQCLVLGRMANLSLEHGSCDGSCLGYVWLGGALGAVFGDYQTGFRFGKLGVDLMENRGLNRFKARVYLGFGSLVNPWTQHMRTGLDSMRRAFTAAQETGDLTYAAYACYDLIAQLLPSGDPLEEVQREAENALEFAKKGRFGLMIDGITGQLGLIRTLRGLTQKFGSFDDAKFEEAQFEQHLASNARLANPACRYWIRKLQARFYAGDEASALAAAEKAGRLLWAMPTSVEVPDYHFHAALVRARHCRDASTDERTQDLEALAAHHKQLEVWARSCPANFHDRVALVAAEIARIEGRELDAQRSYEEAIESARENGFIQNEAVASEVACRFYRDRGFEMIGYAYLRNARSCYRRWGALGKVKQLDKLYPGLNELAPAGQIITMGASVQQLDLATVVRAMQAVSREVDLEKLIETLMMIAVECAGAERGLLFLPRGQEHEIVAEAATRDDKVQVILAQAFATPPKFAESIVRYVIRTQEKMILDDALVESRFSHDDYVRALQVRSVLCFPLTKLGTLTGLLYLENNLAPRAFTSDRFAVLELLGSQAAISLENARLYADLRQEISERSKTEEALGASEERMNLAAEAANLAMWQWDAEKDEIWMTDKGRALYGFAADTRLDAAAVAAHVHPEDRAARNEAIKRALETRGEVASEYRLLLPDGTLRWIESRGRCVDAGKSKGIQLLGVSLDVTTQKQAEAKAWKQQEELAHLSRVALMGEMAGALAHELNQPLTGIVTNASAARRFIAKGRADLPKLDSLFEAVIEDGRRAGEIIRGIRGMVHKGNEVRGPVNLNDVIASVLRFVRSDALERHFVLVTELDPELAPVEADRVQLQQVLLNLIVNAFEAMREAPVTKRRVIIRSERESGGRVRVSVRDFGTGLPVEEPERIFERFFSTKREGMGMGLAIARSIIASHGGELAAVNADGGGACVYFSLSAQGEG